MGDDEVFEAVRTGDLMRLRAIVDADPRRARARDGSGVSVLMTALYSRHREQAEFLSRNAGQLDIFEASALGDAGHVRELIAAHPDQVDAWSSDGFTGLHFAAFFNHPETVRILLHAGADPNRISKHTMRVMPLHSAATNVGATDVVRSLLEAGALPDAKQQDGFTPLIEAAQNGDEPMARVLVQHGADPSATRDDGQTAADVAQSHGHTQLAALLREQETARRCTASMPASGLSSWFLRELSLRETEMAVVGPRSGPRKADRHLART